MSSVADRCQSFPPSILFIRGPRMIWANINEDDNFLAPLNYPCLAAAVRRAFPDVKIRILDCCAEKLGWRSLERFIAENHFDLVGIGDESFNCAAGQRTLRLVRQHHPDTITVAGGRHFTFNPQDGFDENLTDFIVRGEGELPLTALVRELGAARPDFASIPGVLFRQDDGTIHDGGFPATVENLDDLPIPAYDLIPVHRYGQNSKLNPNSVSIQHGRGCTFGCTFCTFWPQEARWSPDAAGVWRPTPSYRTKSAARTVEEVELLTEKYNKDYLYWVDGTFDADSEWNEQFADEILRRGIKVNWWCYSRADCVLRDEERGVFEKTVRAGLRHPLFGAERVRPDDLAALNKSRDNADNVRAVMRLFDRKYPMLIKHVTFVAGMEHDTRETLRELYEYAVSLRCDIASLNYLTPMPGTALHEEMKAKGRIKVFDLGQYDWFTPVMDTEHLSLAELDKFVTPKILTVNFRNFGNKLRRQFTKHESVRRVNRYGGMMALRYLKGLAALPFRKAGRKFRGMAPPPWYND